MIAYSKPLKRSCIGYQIWYLKSKIWFCINYITYYYVYHIGVIKIQIISNPIILDLLEIF